MPGILRHSFVCARSSASVSSGPHCRACLIFPAFGLLLLSATMKDIPLIRQARAYQKID